MWDGHFFFYAASVLDFLIVLLAKRSASFRKGGGRLYKQRFAPVAKGWKTKRLLTVLESPGLGSVELIVTATLSG